MEEIKENDYIRTKKKGIFKVLTIKKTAYGYLCGTTDNDNISTFTIGKGGNAEIKNDIFKHSSNIIDLIEVGDYVNGTEIITIYGYDEDGNDKDGLGICETDDDYAYYTYLEDIDIRTIVTKEQFASMEYRLEE